MVTTANRNREWQRASYLEVEGSRVPQSIAALLPQVLARYSIAPETVSDVRVQKDEREYEGEEDVHTLAATGTLGS